MFQKTVLMLLVLFPAISFSDGGEIPLNSPAGKVCDNCSDNIHWYQQESLKAERWREDPPFIHDPVICNLDDKTIGCSGYELSGPRELYEFVGLVYVMVYIEVDDRIKEPWRFALQKIRRATQTFQRSGVPVQFVVAGIKTVDNGDKAMQTILNDLRSRTNEITEETGADLIMGLLPPSNLIFGPTFKYCGLASVGRGYAWPNVSVTACYDRYTLEHEIGHNFGLMHDSGAVGGGGTNPFLYVGRGYIPPTGDRGTIMAYADKRVPFFSSPKVEVDGVVYGSEDHDAVSALNDALGNVAMAHETYMESRAQSADPLDEVAPATPRFKNHIHDEEILYCD